ncbi:MAG: helix-turn-helix domain-containing protein [Oscillospiraceae bacterium]|jgi:excisionase family DNA binding protein|nr:helix-turn-helix domain-containing protein [Oscillospiraceae bacterium]
MEMTKQEIYRVVFKEYPDILDVKQVSVLLGVSTKTVYRLLRDGTLDSLKIGREFRIPKVNVMRYAKIFGSPLCEQTTV